MKKSFKKIISLIIIMILIVLGINLFKGNLLVFNEDKIDKILRTKEYSYLAKEAKEYIRQVYEKTGQIMLTEKNKRANTPYLNPEFINYLTLTVEEKKEQELIPTTTVVDYSPRNIQSNVELPSSYDLRDVDGNNYVTPVRNQGNLGICWTFATAGAIESHLLKKYNNPYDSNSKLVSERQIDYITSKDGIKNYKSEYKSFIDRNLGDGGNIYVSTIAIANGVSIIDYNSFKPYNDRDLQKMELSEIINYSNSMYEANSTINMPRLNLRESTMMLTEEQKNTRTEFLNEIKRNIMNNGASYVSTYMDSSCRYVDSNLGNTVIDVYNCNPSGGHAMQIIGWDDDLEYSYCASTVKHNSNTSNCNTIVSGKGVWILKNSWGNELQHPYLTYDSMYTGISFINELEKDTDKDWDNNYLLGDEDEDIKNKTYNLSSTKIKDNEIIKKVKFIAATSDTTYQVKVEKISGGYEIFSKKVDLPGLVTIETPGNIKINKNTDIIITGNNEYIDKVMIFTSNVNEDPYINLEKYNNIEISKQEIRLYSDTKNIPSNSAITYKIYNSSNVDVSDKITVTNNTIAENNINTLISFSDELANGTYKIDAMYNSNIIASINIERKGMDGSGTEEDPYIITNPIQLDQIRNDLDGYYVLGNDIDLTEATRDGGELSTEANTCPQEFGWKSISGFSGTLDGRGHSIKGLYQKNYITCNNDAVDTTYYEWVNTGNGLFSSAKGNLTIKNIVFEDFDITCHNGNNSEMCSVIVSNYVSNSKDDSTVYNAKLENITVKNGSVKFQRGTGGGVFGNIENDYGNVTLSNIYVDYNLDLKGSQTSAYLVYWIQGETVNINNIQMAGKLIGINNDGSGLALLNYSMFPQISFNINNILSTVEATKIQGQLLGSVWGHKENLRINGINMFNNEDKNLAGRFDNEDSSSITNVNIYDKNTEVIELTKKSNYSSWENFDDHWEMKKIDGIPRIPVLKNIDFEYTTIPNINIDQELNKKYNIYDYITPKTDSARRISYNPNDESVIIIDDNGTIIPQKNGNTSIHVESLYDGYINDVPVSVNYVPNYKIFFDANGGTGEMDWYEVNANEDCIIPKNEFEREHYLFKEWNTEPDGTGTAYSDLSNFKGLNDGQSVTLYAQWIGEELVVTFDPNGGSVSPEKKVVRYGESYGELPLPTREGYGFTGWSTSSLSIDYLTTKLYGLNLTAGWRENAYTILYDGNGGKIKPETNCTAVLSESLISSWGLLQYSNRLIGSEFIKNNYELKEWNTKADGTGTSYSLNEEIKLTSVENSLLHLYAIWVPDNKSYDITIDSDSVVSDTFNVKLNIESLNENAIKLNSLTGNINYDKTKLELIEYSTIDGFNLSFNNNGFNIFSNNGISTSDKILVLKFKNIGLQEFEKTTITFNELHANNGELNIVKDSITKEVIYSENGFIKGDINHNGKIDLKDIILLIKKYLGTEDVNNSDITIGDMNNNNKLDLKDIILLIRLYLN